MHDAFPSFLEDPMTTLAHQARALNIPEGDIQKICMEKDCRLRLVFPAETRQLELIRRIARSTAEITTGLDSDTADDIVLALDEACTNVIVHAYGPHAPDAFIEAEIRISSKDVTIILTDQGVHGRGFHPEKLPPPDIKALFTHPKPGGLGFHLIKTIMDEVRYEKGPGSTNRLTMKRYLSRSG
ncbi:serine/threonine-protein kinase RsbW [Desulfobotulus alkaliphilus]|uniref:Serine/threonine-protein kinase RsbW n=1 Tax=Desulfobotulus alkaliphilus TaxID=622671 RepID=A0A562SA00_9BACT|nr:ATP-binding protein [Desulfobotulus alkaliphilus]TWI77390.1 serine/threonine-protein kinase RsbW [Desulfobotulus alkaliphilus]